MKGASVFLNNDKATGASNGAVTIIGPGVRIEGNISFSGYLRVQGEVLGDIVCLDERHGTTVVHGAGLVTGSIKSPNVIVGGRVQGPIHGSTSIEVHRGASVAGDLHYKQLAIHEGGVIEGLLKASTSPEQQAWQDRRIARPESPDIKELDGPHAHERRASDQFWSKRKFAIGGVLAAILAIAFFWPRQEAPQAESPVFVPEPPAAAAPLPEPEKTEPPPPSPVVAPEPPVAPAPVTAVELRKADPNRVITVEGLDPAKPSDLFFVATKEPIVLFRKQRSEPGDGTRIDLDSGIKRRFPISADEVVRIAAGKDLEMFYQGRKLSWGALHSGAWMRFVALPPNAAAQ